MDGIDLHSQNESSQVKMHFFIIIILIETELRTGILFVIFFFFFCRKPSNLPELIVFTAQM